MRSPVSPALRAENECESARLVVLKQQAAGQGAGSCAAPGAVRWQATAGALATLRAPPRRAQRLSRAGEGHGGAGWYWA